MGRRSQPPILAPSPTMEGTYYDTYVALDPQGREWKFMSDASINPERKEEEPRGSQ